MILRENHDVLVAGGGVAGVGAAVAAAREGARTLLVEKDNFLGGLGFSGMHQYICGLFLNGEVAPDETINPGIVREIVGFLKKLSPEKKIKRIGKVYVLPYSRFDLQYVLNRLCAQESKLTVLLNSTVFAIKKADGNIREVALAHQGERLTGSPKAVIDCTGNANLAVMAGADFQLAEADDLQLSGYTVKLSGLAEADETLALKVPYYLAEAAREGALPEELRFSNYIPGDKPDEGYCKFSLDMNVQNVTRAQEFALTAHKYLSGKIPALKGSRISECSLGVVGREGRRVCGEYTLTEDDVLSGRKFDDGVVRNSWPIEIWDKRKGTMYKYLEPGNYYEIPFRSLKVKGIDNMLCAGRNISVSHEAYGSTRVMGCCLAMGEQAGKAAAYHLSPRTLTV